MAPTAGCASGPITLPFNAAEREETTSVTSTVCPGINVNSLERISSRWISTWAKETLEGVETEMTHVPTPKLALAPQFSIWPRGSSGGEARRT